MKKIILICFVLFCFVKKQKAQNLVPNPSFEQQNDCNNSLISSAIPWNSVCVGGGGCASLSPCKSDSYTQAPFQYFNTCFQSYQLPRTGVSYAEFGTYIQPILPQSYIPFVKLIDTLNVGKIYCVTYYVSMWDNARYGLDKLGALFTSTALPIQNLTCNSTNTISVVSSYTPQIITPTGIVFEDTLNWMEVSGVYTAMGNEAYMAIGDLLLNSNHFIKDSYPTNCNGIAEYYVDDVSVEEVHLAKCKKDTAICPNDSVIIGNNVSEATAYNWQPTSGLSCTNCANPKASPNTTTTYTLTKTQCKAITTASITVTIKTDCTPKVILSEIPNVFTPNGDGVNDTFNFTIVGASDVSFTVYDRWGLEVASNPSPSGRLGGAWDGHTTSGVECSEGIYFYTLEYKDAKGDTQKKNGYVSLFR